MAGIARFVWSRDHAQLVGAARVVGLGATRTWHARPNGRRILTEPGRGGSSPTARPGWELSITSMATVRRDADRYGEMVQLAKGLRLHSTYGRRRQRRVCPY